MQTKGMGIEVLSDMISVQKSVSILVIFSRVFFVGLFWSAAAFADLLATVETKGLSFISQDYENTKSSNFGFFGATFKSLKADDDVFKMNITGQYAMGNPVLSYLNVREIYFTYKIDSTSEIHIGRKINIWSNVDDRWNLGFFQPQFRWNALSPENQGLTGFFWQKKNNGYGFQLFASPLFIPDQGPGYELKNGQFESNSPWFQPPPQNVLFQNQLLPIDYQIENPNISDIIFQPNYGLQIQYGESTGFFISLASIYKPSHQVALGYKGILVTDHVKVNILPKTYYENVTAADFGYLHDWGAVDFSVLYLRPENPEFDAAYNKPLISESLSYGAHAKLNVTEQLTFDLNALMSNGNDITESGPDADPLRQPLTTKFLFTSAYEISATYTDVFKNQLRLFSQLTWRQAQKNELRILKSKNYIDLKGPWKFMLDFILIETSDESTNLSSYRNLDQLWLGASYDF